MEQMEQLKLLMQYTIFHVGVYLTLGSLMLTVLVKESARAFAKVMQVYIFIALGCFLVAGVCGGIVAGNIPYFDKFSTFETSRIGPWFVPKSLFVPASWIMRLEHSAFWIGIIVFLLGFFKHRAWSLTDTEPPTAAGS
jgi:hypothetical protein